MRILLVEDDDSTARAIELMLKAEGWIVDVTDQGEDALEIGQLYDYELILLDIMLPDMDGYEVLRRLRQARVRTKLGRAHVRTPITNAHIVSRLLLATNISILRETRD